MINAESVFHQSSEALPENDSHDEFITAFSSIKHLPQAIVKGLPACVGIHKGRASSRTPAINTVRPETRI